MENANLTMSKSLALGNSCSKPFFLYTGFWLQVGLIDLKKKEKKKKKRKEKKLSKDTSYLLGPPLLYFHLNPLIPLQLAKSALSFWMYPKAKAHFFRHLAIPGFPLSDHTVSKPVQWPVACQMWSTAVGIGCSIIASPNI